ncbi:hypothetical protein Poli38472_001508 [Pythium oligandrum]|uniref:Uncharacterized protein n=1 Tax=Pythium oligandrum TaxID=41045 RepID=A0A8K1CT07_PYTOL|nr:hypothetical protein Poli38472_001508 [Pythium oligandrum]|eukprot:TMW69352.1 hypothetical protein Poli38472_001508 [Pythium oligandrum]
MTHETTAIQQRRDAEARKWWAERENEVEKELSATLHKRMEAQRAQIHAFKMEQSKWEHELQLRISKYAHDRKLLSEHNIELQEALTSMEEKYAKLEREMDRQAVHVLELEGQLVESELHAAQIKVLRAENEELRERVMRWESCHEAEIAAAVQRQEQTQNELFQGLERRIEELTKENANLRERRKRGSSHSNGTRDSSGDESSLRRSEDSHHQNEQDDEDDESRVAELERTVKHKDQTIVTLKALLERHEAISDEKTKLLQAKYDQVKAINIALQRKLLNSLAD